MFFTSEVKHVNCFGIDQAHCLKRLVFVQYSGANKLIVLK